MDKVISAESAALFSFQQGAHGPDRRALRCPDNRLRKEGWARFALADLPCPPWRRSGFDAFALRIAKNLPPDLYDPTGLRRRRYGVFIWTPGTDEIIPVSREFNESGMPVTPYLQGDEYQSEFGNEVRWFPALEEWSLSSPLLADLVRADGMVARKAGVLPDAPAYYIGVHAIALAPAPGCRAVITPNEIHCDGEPVTFVHLLRRANVTGGWNAVADRKAIGKHPDEVPGELVLARFSLATPGDGFVVDDRRVAHFVEGVSLEDETKPGERTVLLIDLCPARRVLAHELG